MALFRQPLGIPSGVGWGALTAVVIAAMVGVLIPLSYVLSLVALEHAPVAEVAALRSTSIVMSGIVAWLALGERLSPRRVASTALATGAVLLIAVSST
ncbi:EamA family transporter [Clavibacter michiganensis]|uniref:EamA family transporter n=1 Tax=Clavibacter michiganensis TaxID=28447 RepID=UPI00105470B2|nr:EamA family transporter [Clavibacter michiganensis]